jgi:hypothetical protein
MDTFRSRHTKTKRCNGRLQRNRGVLSLSYRFRCRPLLLKLLYLDFTPLFKSLPSYILTYRSISRLNSLMDKSNNADSSDQIARAFGWADCYAKTTKTPSDPEWPGTSHMTAEWLHRCAYSWGGLKNTLASSQVPQNLIFGTGECNSVMTRFEKAWQSLVCREGDRENGTGRLSANINRDKDSELYRLDELKIEEPATSEVHIEQLPHWLCYALDYELQQNKPIAPFNNRSCFKTTFFLWQRGFFTKFEQTLDEAVIDLAYEPWEKRDPPPKYHGGLVTPIEEKPIKEIRISSWHDGIHQYDGSETKKKQELEDQLHTQTAMFLMESDQKEFLPMSINDETVEADGATEETVEVTESILDTTDAILETTEHVSHIHKEATEVLDAPLRYATILTVEGPTAQMSAIWEKVHAPGPTYIGGLAFSNAKIVVGSSEPTGSIVASVFVNDDHDNAGFSGNADQVTARVQGSDERAEIEVSSPRNGDCSGAKEETLLALQVDPKPELVFGRIETTKRQTRHAQRAEIVEEIGIATKRSSEQTTKPEQDRITMTPAKPPQETTKYGSTESLSVANMFVVEGDIDLFGKHKDLKLYNLQSSTQTGDQHFRITMPKVISLGAFMPSLAGSDLDAIAMRDTTLTYRSQGRRSALTLASTITISGML